MESILIELFPLITNVCLLILTEHKHAGNFQMVAPEQLKVPTFRIKIPISINIGHSKVLKLIQ